MLIRNIQEVHEGDQYRVQADVTLESRPLKETLFFSVPAEQAGWIRPEPNAFMVGSAMAALWLGEERISLDVGVDPQLGDRLNMAMRFMKQGHKSPSPIPTIEAPAIRHPMPTIPHSTTAIFLSGGVDSTAALYWNTSQYDKGDPRRVSVAFFVHGLDVGDPNKTDRLDVWNLGIQKLSGLCQELGVELVTVKVNLRSLAKSWRFYSKWQFASLLAAIAHTASSRIFRCIISPDNELEHTRFPHGSHPWLNSYYGADFLEITSGDMERFSRLEKIRMLSQQPNCHSGLRVCWDTGAIPSGHLNCGRCSKCIRTMLEFMACGQLETMGAFPLHHVTPAMLAPLHIRSSTEREYFGELIPALKAIGRQDLASIVSRKLWLFNAEHKLRLNHLRPVVKKMLGRS